MRIIIGGAIAEQEFTLFYIFNLF